jgi:hypothetical protein
MSTQGVVALCRDESHDTNRGIDDCSVVLDVDVTQCMRLLEQSHSCIGWSGTASHAALTVADDCQFCHGFFSFFLFAQTLNLGCEKGYFKVDRCGGNQV